MLHSTPPSKILLPFASNGVKNVIPVASQIGITPGAASFTDGFPPPTMMPLASGGIPPSGADFNGVLNQITANQQWQAAGGLYTYDAAFASQIGGYPMGAILSKIDGTGFWLNKIDANSSNPDAGGAGWEDNNTSPTRPVSDKSNFNATTAFVSNAIAEAGVGSPGGGSGPFAPQTNPAGGANNYAPLDSPVFIGTPMVPTAATGAAASQQAASLAYVQALIKTPGNILPGNKYIWTGGGTFYTNGYQVLPGGIMIQWGLTAPTVNPYNSTTYFNIAFPNQNMMVLGTSDNSTAIINIIPVTSSYFIWNAVAPGGGAAGSVSLSWIAIGY